MSELAVHSARLDGIRIAIAWLQSRSRSASDPSEAAALTAACLAMHRELVALDN